MTNDGFEVMTAEETEAAGFRKTRGSYKTRNSIIDFDNGDGFQVLDEQQTEEEFGLIAPELFDSLPKRTYKNSYDIRKSLASNNRPVIFIDGEGSNDGEPIITFGGPPYLLKRTIQKQNYSLLSVTIDGAECDIECTGDCEQSRHIIGKDNFEQLPSTQCLDFILNLPATHVIVGFGLSYDIEHWLKDLSPERMVALLRDGHVWWRNRYRISYIPRKTFTVSRYSKRKKVASRTIYDIWGFFQGTFVGAIEKWKIGNDAEYQFISRMKKGRAEFGPITPEVLAYNHMEGKHGIRLYRRVREEWQKLGLHVIRPVGAGSIATAMFRKHHIEDYMPTFQPLPTEVMLQAYIGGRADIGKIGLFNSAYDNDINSCYPHIARNLPCLAHSRFEWTDGYDRSPYSLWLVRWRDNENRWSPFPYRSGTHIRYYSSGMGYYYTDEVESGLRIDSDIEILGGYKLVRECDERPFQWLEEYYKLRLEMKSRKDFGEIILKLGPNSVYGKLAQAKGKAPPYQNLIWAGMITSGARAMLMNAVARNPSAILLLATDAVFSTIPLALPIGDGLGQWKTTKIDNFLLLGNGIYDGWDSHTGERISRNRGYHGGAEFFDWDLIRKNYPDIPTVVTKRDFIGFKEAFHEKQLSKRCVWQSLEELQSYKTPEKKEFRSGWIWPGSNPTPGEISGPIKIDPANLRVFGQHKIVTSD